MNPNYHILKNGTYVYHCRYCKKTFRDDLDYNGDDKRDEHEKTHKEYVEL